MVVRKDASALADRICFHNDVDALSNASDNGPRMAAEPIMVTNPNNPTLPQLDWSGKKS